MDNNHSDVEGETKKRRSSRLSGSYGKRKRDHTEEEEIRPKMTKTGEASEPATVNFTMDDIRKFMNGEFLDSVNLNMDRNIKKLSDRIDDTQQELRTHKDHVNEELAKMRQELDTDRCLPIPIPEIPSSYAAAVACPQVLGSSTSANEQQAKLYWRARKSSRFFPVFGETEDEIRRNLKDFCVSKLKIPSADILDEDVEHVRRVRLRRERNNLGEVIVVFSNIEN